MDLEVDKDFEKNHDIDFLIYKRNIREDNHVLRYCFDNKTTPLFFSSFGKFDIDNVKNCNSCGAKRIFEF